VFYSKQTDQDLAMEYKEEETASGTRLVAKQSLAYIILTSVLLVLVSLLRCLAPIYIRSVDSV